MWVGKHAGGGRSTNSLERCREMIDLRDKLEEVCLFEDVADAKCSGTAGGLVLSRSKAMHLMKRTVSDAASMV